MLILYLALLLLVVFSLSYKRTGYYEDFLSLDTTNSIKGVFILLVFLSHIIPYISNAGYAYDGVGDKLFTALSSRIGQWIVTLFLFYSGYGIMEGIKRKGDAYINAIPRKRLLTVLLNFDIAVLVYTCIHLMLQGAEGWNTQQFLLSLTGWESMGTSNWYIFVILLAYAITYISFKFVQTKHKHLAPFGIMAQLFVSMLILSFLKGSWWYDTILCFGAGLLFSTYKEQCIKLILKYRVTIFFLLVTFLCAMYFCPYWMRGLKYNLFSIAFCLLVILISMFVKINNKVLIWLGQNLFPLYIYQRVPMIILSTVGGGILANTYPVLYIGACLAITLGITYFYKYWAIKL